MAIQTGYQRSHDFGDSALPKGPNDGVTARFFSEYVEAVGAERGADGKFPLRKIDMVEILIAGDAKAVPVMRARDHHKARFANAWEAYQRGETVREGTPLDHMAGKLDPRTMAVLNAHNVFSIEALAGLSDAACQRIGMGASKLRAEADIWLRVNVQPKAAKAEAVAAENEELKARLAALEARLGAPEEPQRRGPGRPRRVDAVMEAEA